MKKHTIAPWVRMITADDSAAPAGSAPTPAQMPQRSAVAPGSADEETAEPPADGEGQDEDPDGRGSKRSVLADLARERDKRQALQAERDELQKQLDEYNRAKMTDQEKLQADLEVERKRAAELEQALTTERRKAWAGQALAEVGLPAAMADRLQGDTLEDIQADAQALKETLGYDRAPVDPSQGKSGAKTTYTTMGDAIAAHYAARK